MELEALREEARKLGYRLIPLDWKRQELAGEKVTSKPKHVTLSKEAQKLETVERAIEPPPERPKVPEEVRQLRLQIKAAGEKFNWAELTRLQLKLATLEGKR